MIRNLMVAGVVACICVVNVQAKDVEDPTHDGKVVSATGSELVMSDKNDKEHSHTLSADTQLTLDGKDCKAEDLKAGMKIRVTTKSGNKKAATRVEAIDRNTTFANTQDGKVVSITDKKLVMTGKDGLELSRSISSDTQLTLDGKACKAGDLKAGMKIRVTTKKTDEGAAVEIEAIDKDAEFARSL